MVTITDQAAAVLFETIRASGVPEGNALRLDATPEGYTLAVDTPAPDDRILMHQEFPVLLIQPDVEDSLGDAIIEVDEGGAGESARLVIRHPD